MLNKADEMAGNLVVSLSEPYHNPTHLPIDRRKKIQIKSQRNTCVQIQSQRGTILRVEGLGLISPAPIIFAE